MFYHYSQNNSGGGFDFVEGQISAHVVIEADSPHEADAKGEAIGLYFDGEGDCPCCGPRWSATYDEGDLVPSIYGEDVSSGVWEARYGGWMGDDDPEGYIHYKDGTVTPVTVKAQGKVNK